MNLLRIISRVPSTLALVSLAACSGPSDRPSEVNTLRVLAVRSETPFAKPGASAELTMLAYDGSPHAKRADATSRETSTLWIGGCNNPPGDGFAGCMPYLHEVLSQFGEGTIPTGTVPATLDSGSIGWGAHFTAPVSANIIESRTIAPGVVYPYGLELVFFAHCGGALQRVAGSTNGLPLGCYDTQTGEPLGRDDFEFGFYPLFSYDALTNANPTLNALRFDETDASSQPACSDSTPCSGA